MQIVLEAKLLCDYRVVDICWIAYLTEKDKGKRIIFDTKQVDHLYQSKCKELKTEKTLVMYNGRFHYILLH